MNIVLRNFAYKNIRPVGVKINVSKHWVKCFTISRIFFAEFYVSKVALVFCIQSRNKFAR